MTLDSSPVVVNTRKAVALIAYLATTGQPHRREALAALLWPELDHRRSRAALRTTLSVLKKVLAGTALVIEKEVINVNTAHLNCDVIQFQELLTACQMHKHEENASCQSCLSRLEKAANLYEGDFMAGFSLSDSAPFDQWQLYQADALRQQLSHVLSQLVQSYTAQNKAALALPHARRWAAHDPLHEPAHRHLMRLYAQSGQRAAALRQYQTCRQILAEELDISPDAETATLYKQIQDRELDTLEDAKRKTLPSIPHPTTPLVGRTAELAQIRERLIHPDCQLLTLVGAGGMGKTRLALEIAQQPPEIFSDGCAFVPLAPVNDVRFLVTAVADALGFSFFGRDAPQQQLLNYLSQKKMLLILDNFEHLLDGLDLVTAVRQQAPHVKLLVTSRERLQLQGEWTLAIKGLSCPPLEGSQTPISSQDDSAVQFFLQVARRIAPHFEAKPEMAAIAQICRLVEGMPLAIELAAAWVRALSCPEIVREIETNLDFLAATLRDVPERHRSLRAVFNHSWHFLTADEKMVFRRLSVFRGGFDRATAAAVTGADIVHLSILLDKSLLRRAAGGRYAIHEALWPYAAEKIRADPHEEQVIRLKHGRYFADFLQQRENWLKGERQKEALADIGAEIENVRLAWQWAVASRDADALEQAAGSLFLYLEMRNAFQDGVAVFQAAAQALAAPHLLTTEAALTAAEEERLLLWAKLLARQGHFQHRLGQYEAAQAALRQSLTITQNIKRNMAARDTMAFALNNLGYVAWSLSQFDLAHSFYQESLTLYRRLDDKWGVARVLNNLAILPQDLAETRSLLQESRHVAQEIGDLWGMARALNNLGIVAASRPEAQERYKASVAICREIGDRFLTTFPLTNLGHTARLAGQFDRAMDYYRESMSLCREIGYQAGVARNLGHLGTAACALGDYELAQQYCQDGLNIGQTLGDQRGMGLLQYTLGQISLARGRFHEAETFFRASLDIFHQADDRQGVAWPRLGLAKTAYRQGRFGPANEEGQAALAIFQEVGDKEGAARACIILGLAAVGKRQEARERLVQALRLAHTLQAIPAVLAALAGLAALEAQSGSRQRALTWLNVVIRHPGAEMATKMQAAQWRAELSEQIEPDETTAVHALPPSKSLNEIVTTILT